MKTFLPRSIAFLLIIIFSFAGYSQTNSTYTISVSTLSGEVVDVKVPNDIRPGDQITGSVSTQTSSAKLEGAVIDVQNKKTDLSKKIFSFIVPAGLTALPFTILSKTGEALCKTNLNVESHVPQFTDFVPIPNNTTTTPVVNRNFTAPSVCIAGTPLTILGGFDGDASNTRVSINKTPCEVIAESPRSTVIMVPPNTEVGAGTLRVTENGNSKSSPIQVANINMSTNKTVLNKGEKTTINVAVSGLEGRMLDGKGYNVTLTNMSPQSIAFSKINGNTIMKELNSSVVTNSNYNFSTEIKGITSGKYTLTAMLNSDWDNYRQQCAMQYQDALDAGVPTELADKYLDFVLAAYHPGTAPGSCRLGPANNGGALSCTNVNCSGICIVFSIPKRGGTDKEPKEEGPSATPAPGRIYFCSCSKWQWW